MFKKIHVYDVDGVLLDSRHRHKYINGVLDIPHYFANCTPENLAKDTVLPYARQYQADCINPEIFTVICSVRAMEEKHIAEIVGRLGAPDKLLLVGETAPDKKGKLQSPSFLKRRELQRVFNLLRLQNLPRTLFEDNANTIRSLSDMFTSTIFIQSNQGVD
jgi:hypothetical protein